MGARPSSFKAPEVVKTDHRAWSDQQRDIFTWFESNSVVPGDTQHLVVRARAGTGKTTTIIEGVDRAPEQDIMLCAFNKRIADELNSRIKNPRAQAKTLHAIGMQAVSRQWRRIPVNNDARSASLTDMVVPKDTPKQIRRLVSMLHTKGREMLPLGYDLKGLINLALFFDYVPDDGWTKYNVEFVAARALEAMSIAAEQDPTYDVGIDFADMIFLPLAWKLLSAEYDLVVVDEAQDMTLSQLTIAQRICNGRICVVGDDKQAIYGFRGADSRSLDRLKTELGAAELPLVTTYRCGQSIVRRAQALVSDIVAGPRNPAGTVDACDEDQLLQLVRPGDFVLSRLNAPLVSITLHLLQKGVRARMAGRDIGKGITAILRRLGVTDGTDLDAVATKLDDWERKMTTKFAAYGQLELVERTHDQADMIRAFIEDADHAGDMMRQIEFLFTDTEQGDRDLVLMSSIHKAKGLEADHVYLLADSFYRRGPSQEEHNIAYVGITRAKSHLTFVNPTEDFQP